MDAQQVIDLLGLQPLPIEGGYFRETWRSMDVVPAGTPGDRWGRFDRDKIAGSAIYYLLTDAPDSFSAFHRLPTDEVYHCYLGDPVEKWHLHRDGRLERVVLGHAIAEGQHVQAIAPAGVWQASRLCPGGRFALLGTTMAPGFDPHDYDHGDRGALLATFPAARDIILALTRDLAGA